MPDPAAINHSLSTIRTELQFLHDCNILSEPQLQSILAQLPQNGAPSPYIDPRYNPSPAAAFNPSLVAQQAQNPANAAHPANPNHHQWALGLAQKFGNAALYGAGATFGSDMINDALKKF